VSHYTKPNGLTYIEKGRERGGGSIDHGVIGGEEHPKLSEGERSRRLLQTPQR